MFTSSIRRIALAALFAASVPGCGSNSEAPVASRVGTLTVTVFQTPTHGLAIALRTPSGRICLIDTGGNTVGYDVGRDTIAPWLKAAGVTKIHAILHSHSDHDHFAGTGWLIDNFKVDQLIDSGTEGEGVPKQYIRLRSRVKDRGGEYAVAAGGDTLAWDPALSIDVLSPPKGGLKPEGSEGKDLTNDNSLVVRVQHGKNVFLFPGDIKSIGRDHLLAAYRADKLKCGFMVAPHHGFSHGRKFAEITKPDVVVVSCKAEYPGKDIVSPGKEAQAFYGSVGSKVYVTAFDGSIEAASDGEAVKVRAIRP
jgi:competence protein ComEC